MGKAWMTDLINTSFPAADKYFSFQAANLLWSRSSCPPVVGTFHAASDHSGLGDPDIWLQNVLSQHPAQPELDQRWTDPDLHWETQIFGFKMYSLNTQHSLNLIRDGLIQIFIHQHGTFART
jgi:hypothetical protein